MNLKSANRLIRIWVLFLCITLAATQYVLADCESDLKLDGMVTVKCCLPREECIRAGEAAYNYTESSKDDPSVLSISMHASPWHLYDSEMRILTVEELADMVRPDLRKGIKRIDLNASWTGVSPVRNGKSLAQKLSELLNGFPVKGMDGFVWIAKDGSLRTTRQAFTGKPKCPYGVHPDEEVMVSLVAGWPIEYEENYISKGNAIGIRQAGAGWDIYMLCPDKALKSFESAAKLSDPIAAYNAALIRLERGTTDDIKAATTLFSKAAALGEKKAEVRLTELKRQGR